MKLTVSDFPAFFSALWGPALSPFDWQTRLLERVRAEGWPSTLDLPTGSGKTATLDIALFALALDAFDPPETRRQPRRIVLVVDRRVVVDQAYERAVHISAKLAEAQEGPLGHVAAALRNISGVSKGPPVMAALLRGGMPREDEWAKTPSQPVFLASTVDQVGSRVLFRGYGVSDRMRPIHAGLLGRDVLYLLDEVHLARPFEETLSAIATSYANREGNAALPKRPLVLVRMSATVAEKSEKDTFGLGPRDRQHDALSRRLGASKLATLRQVKAPRDPAKAGEALAKAAIREVERLGQGNSRAVAVIVNRVNTAAQVAALTKQRLTDWTVSLLTGRMRPLDRDDRRAAIFDRIRSGRNRAEESERILIVSTQALEAGADFDFDALVTECASLDALRQRFGRLDRLGEIGTTEAVVLAASSSVDDKADADPIYGNALRATWHWLNLVAEKSTDRDGPIVNFGIDALSAKLEQLSPSKQAELLAPRTVAPVLTASHLDRWAQTSPAPSADPDVAPFLHGLGRGTPEVQIVWRADFEEELMTERYLEVLRGVLETVRPSSLEALSVPLWSARRWLATVHARRKPDVSTKSLGSPELADVEGAASVDDSEIENVAPVILWRGDNTRITSKASDIRAGDTLVVPSNYGGLDPEFECWNPDSATPVRDRGDEAQLRQRRKAILRWHPAVILSWGATLPNDLSNGPTVSSADVAEYGRQAEREAFQEWRKAVLEQEGLPGWVRLALSALAQRVTVSTFEVAPTDSGEDGDVRLWRVSWQPKRVANRELRFLLGMPSIEVAGEAATEEDEGSFLGKPVPLRKHLDGVRDLARAYASVLSLPETLAGDVALAAWLHDVGKADPRFQLLLHGGDPVKQAAAEELIAKSALSANDRKARERARERSRYPRGTRHELMSVALIEGNSELRSRATDWDLVLHLVGSHHGWCRPFGPAVLDPEPVQVTLSLDALELTRTSDHGLSRIDSGVVDRFWQLVRRYGWWGLAWLEAIVRLADHRESERESRENDGEGNEA